MSTLLSFLTNRNFLFGAAIAAGFMLPSAAYPIKSYILHILAVVMSFALTGIETSSLKQVHEMPKPMLFGFVFSYLIHGPLIVLLAWLLMPTYELFAGFVVIAAAPCGVGVIPFAFILKSDIRLAAFGVLGTYFASFFMVPLYIVLFTDGSSVPFTEIVRVMIFLLVIPMLASRLLIVPVVHRVVVRLRGAMVNLGFALVIYAVLGINRAVFYNDPGTLCYVGLIAFFATFGLGILIHWFTRHFRQGVGYEQRMSEMLMGSIKNNGFAIAVSVSLFPKEASIPPVMLGLLMVIYFLFLSVRFGSVYR